MQFLKKMDAYPTENSVILIPVKTKVCVFHLRNREVRLKLNAQ